MKSDQTLRLELKSQLYYRVYYQVWEHLSLDANTCVDSSVRRQLSGIIDSIENTIWERVRADVRHQLQSNRPLFTEYLYSNV